MKRKNAQSRTQGSALLVTQEKAAITAVFVTLSVCAGGLLFRFGSWQIWVGTLLALTALVAFRSIGAAIAILIAISPYNLALRWVEADTPLIIRGLRDLISYMIFAIFWVRYAGRSQSRGHTTAALVFVGWCILVTAVNFQGMREAILGLRQLVQFFLLFPVVVVIASERDSKAAENLLSVIVITVGILSVVQLLLYKGYFELPLREADQPGELLRYVGGEQVARMIPIWEISPSGLAIYMVSATLIGIARFVETGRVPLLWLPCLAGAMICAWLTLSHSAILAFLLGCGIIALLGKKKWFAFIFAALFAACWPILFGGRSFTDKTTAEYSATFLRMWESDLQTALAHPIFGTGAAPAGYLADLVGSEVRTVGDGGWALFACQVGIPAAAVMLVWAVSILGVAGGSLMKRHAGQADPQPWVRLAALVAAAAYFVNAHGVPWYRVGADVNFIVLTGILTALAPTGLVVSRKLARKPRRATSKGALPAAASQS
jgi:hypothetical protein